jgi:hypothetical protein
MAPPNKPGSASASRIESSESFDAMFRAGLDIGASPPLGYTGKDSVDVVIDRPSPALKADGFEHATKVAGQPVVHVQITGIVALGHASLKPFALE